MKDLVKIETKLFVRNKMFYLLSSLEFVFLTISLHTATFAANPIILTRILSFTSAFIVLLISPGSKDNNEPNIIRTSRVQCEGTCLL